MSARAAADLLALTGGDLRAAAQTAWGEARGEGEAGLAAVVWVGINRARDPRWPDRLAAVFRQPRQFSCWNRDDPNRARIERLDWSHAGYRLALQVAAGCLAGEIADLTGGAVLYHAGYVTPAWARHPRVRETARIGRHIFYWEAPARGG